VHGTVPDISFTIEDFAEQGDKIWVRVRVRARGTATGLFGPPSNKPIDITVFDLARITGGQIIEHWECPTASPCSRRPACLTGWWRADSVIAAAPSAPPGTEPVDIEAILRASMARWQEGGLSKASCDKTCRCHDQPSLAASVRRRLLAGKPEFCLP
jgi:SnoaL-like polyketide cyclase